MLWFGADAADGHRAARVPDREVLRRLIQLGGLSILHSMTYVVATRGIGASMVRAALIGITMAARRRPERTFTDASGLRDWLAALPEPPLPHDVDAALQWLTEPWARARAQAG